MTEMHTLRREGVTEVRNEQARRAVKAFRAFQPTLSAYARVFTGNPKIRVEMHTSSNGHTDGKVIYYRPPIEMGDNTPHIRKLCDKRDEYMQLLCKACRIREHVLVVIYHEIAHIAEGTFKETTEEEKAEAIQRAIKEVGGKYAVQIEQRVKNSAKTLTSSYLGLAGIISPFLPVLVNALEDARVNSATFNKRKGTRLMFNADTQNIFTQGVEQKDKETGQIIKVKWCDYPLNSQVSVGVFCKASGYKYEGWFAPVVEQALNDPELTEIVGRMDGATSASDSYELSFPILARLRELGFCKSDTDPEEEEPNEQQDSSEEGLQNPGGNESENEGGSDSSSVPSDEDDEAGSDDASPEPGLESGDSPSESSGSGTEAGEETEEDSAGGDERSDSGDEGNSSAGEEAESSDGNGSEDESETDASGSSEGGESSEDASDGQPQRSSDPSGEDGESSGGSSMGESVPEQEGGDVGDRDTDGEGASEGHSDDKSSDSDQHGEESDEDDSDNQAEASDEGPSGEGDALDEDRDGEASGRAEHDSGLEHGEVPGDVDPLGDDSESDGDADSPSGGESTEGHGSGDEDGPLDTGADEGLGGVELVIPDDAVMGDADDAMEGLLKVEQHEDRPETAEMRENDRAMETAVIQGLYFETPSTAVVGVRENKYGVNESGRSGKINAWEKTRLTINKAQRINNGMDGDFDPSEQILGPALLHMRVVFSDNKRGKNTVHLKSGRVNGKVLGRRAPTHDPRLFKKRTQPGKKDYFVVIGVDISGSTTGLNLVLTKKAVMAQATLLSRMGIKFAIYAHSGVYLANDWRSNRTAELDIYHVKDAEEPWSEEVKNRLRELAAYEVNLDGHALEYLRKVADRSNATDKIILYYSDGKMPAENYEEELEILQREIKICARKDYNLLGVGIRTDSPARHGLDTVQVDDDSDLIKVVRHIEGKLLAS